MSEKRQAFIRNIFLNSMQYLLAKKENLTCLSLAILEIGDNIWLLEFLAHCIYRRPVQFL